jgi:hypothetical protein
MYSLFKIKNFLNYASVENANHSLYFRKKERNLTKVETSKEQQMFVKYGKFIFRNLTGSMKMEILRKYGRWF